MMFLASCNNCFGFHENTRQTIVRLNTPYQVKFYLLFNCIDSDGKVQQTKDKKH